MRITYVIESWDRKDVLGYYTRRGDALEYIKRHAPTARLLALQGPYFGEGYHWYRLAWDGKRFYKV